MRVVNYPERDGPPRRRGLRYRSLPLWLQWFLPFAVAGAIVLAVVLYVNYETNDVPLYAPITSPAAITEQNREANILVRQQQAPQVVKLKPGKSPAAETRSAVVAYMTRQINIGTFAGPIRSSSCSPAAGSTSGSLLLHCKVTASAQMVTYPFDAVVRSAAGVITYCRRVEPPIPSMNVPVSKRCT